jgi:hypothetical protein
MKSACCKVFDALCGQEEKLMIWLHVALSHVKWSVHPYLTVGSFETC